MEFHEINNEDDIKLLMQKFDGFHDSCIKEILYYSGASVDKSGAMYPFNDKRIVKIIVQSQYADVRVIEMKFDFVHKLNLEPRLPTYDCVIYGAVLKKVGDLFYWSDYYDFDANRLEDMDVTWISAEKVSWRELEGALGEECIYK